MWCSATVLPVNASPASTAIPLSLSNWSKLGGQGTLQPYVELKRISGDAGAEPQNDENNSDRDTAYKRRWGGVLRLLSGVFNPMTYAHTAYFEERQQCEAKGIDALGRKQRCGTNASLRRKLRVTADTQWAIACSPPPLTSTPRPPETQRHLVLPTTFSATVSTAFDRETALLSYTHARPFPYLD